jgi:hypothetical protein
MSRRRRLSGVRLSRRGVRFRGRGAVVLRLGRRWCTPLWLLWRGTVLLWCAILLLGSAVLLAELLSWGSAILLKRCSSVLLSWSAAVLLRWSISVLLRWRSTILLRWRRGTPLLLRRGIAIAILVLVVHPVEGSQTASVLDDIHRDKG